MILSLTYIFLLSLFFSYILEKLNIPTLVGMIAAGMILGPYCINILDNDLLKISSNLREFALIIILLRAGLALKLEDFKKIGVCAFLLSFIPAISEILAFTIFAPLIFGISYMEAILMGAVLSAVSPAVIVPKMLSLIKKNIGTKRKIPQLILAGASLDDIFVIIIFYTTLRIIKFGKIDLLSIINLPISIVNGFIIGFILALVLNKILRFLKLNQISKVIFLVSLSILIVNYESFSIFPYSAYISVITMAFTVNRYYKDLSKKLSLSLEPIWNISMIWLFALVGATVNIKHAINAGILGTILILIALLFRLIAVFLCLKTTNLKNKEKLFAMISYTPKATVQAAIGAIPLSYDIASGELILSIAVLSILITAPIGAFLMEKTSKSLLN